MIDAYKIDMKRRGLTPASTKRLIDQLHSFDRWLAVPITDATAEQIQCFLDARVSVHGGMPISARTRYHYLSTLHNFYVFAVRRGMAELDPTCEIERPKLRVITPRPVTDADKDLAIDYAPRDTAAILRLGAYCGLRCAEVASLTRDAVLEDTMNLRVLGKGQKERIVPMPPSVYRSLLAHGMRRSGPIFDRPMGGPWSPQALSRALSTYLQGVGVDATFHQFRHWYGTRLYAECRDLLLVQYLMGHASSASTVGYVAFSREGAAATVAALPGAA